MPRSEYNVLVLMSDQHSKRQLGCYGDGLVRTPTLDRLASEGMLLENAYCPAPICIPSRMSFMTSRRPTANRVWTNQHILSSGIPTWAHAMSNAGYETALVGRMHFWGPDQRHGFERRPVGEYWAGHRGAPSTGMEREEGPPLFTAIPGAAAGQTRVSVEMAGVGVTSYHALDEIVTEGLLEYIDEKAADGAGDRPFAAVAGFLMPHCPYFAPQELFDYYYDRVDVPQPTQDELDRQPQSIKDMKRRRGYDRPLTEHQIRVARAAYYGMCEWFDRRIGMVLDRLDETGLAENTLVVYTTDHGEAAGTHGMWSKSTFYEESVGVPMIARLPGVVPAGARSPAICNLMDLGPTFTEMAGADPLPGVDGRSLWTELQGRRDESRPDETYSEIHGDYGRLSEEMDPPSRMVRKGPWKLIKYRGETPPVLYNLDDDPAELNDLGSDPQHTGVREMLLKRLYDGWDPDDVYEQSMAMQLDADVIGKWGETVKPEHEDTVPIPPDAEQIELR